MMYDRPGMIRKQVYIEASQDRRLKSRARELGVTEAELIRRGLDQSLAIGIARRPNPAAWDAIERFIRSRRHGRRASASRRRAWRRDDLYDE
jgi:hypothetical protein